MTDATAHGASEGVMKMHLRVLAAMIGMMPKDNDGEFTMTPVSLTLMPFVWLMAVRKDILRRHRLPDNAVLLSLLPEVELKHE